MLSVVHRAPASAGQAPGGHQRLRKVAGGAVRAASLEEGGPGVQRAPTLRPPNFPMTHSESDAQVGALGFVNGTTQLLVTAVVEDQYLQLSSFTD